MDTYSSLSYIFINQLDSYFDEGEERITADFLKEMLFSRKVRFYHQNSDESIDLSDNAKNSFEDGLLIPNFTEIQCTINIDKNEYRVSMDDTKNYLLNKGFIFKDGKEEKWDNASLSQKSIKLTLQPSKRETIANKEEVKLTDFEKRKECTQESAHAKKIIRVPAQSYAIKGTAQEQIDALKKQGITHDAMLAKIVCKPGDRTGFGLTEVGRALFPNRKCEDKDLRDKVNKLMACAEKEFAFVIE